MASVLSLMQDAAVETHLQRVSTIIGSTTDQTAMLLSRALHKTARELQDFGWQKLVREQTFTTVAAETQTGTPLPTTLRHFVANTFYNRAPRQRIFGPLTADEWQSQKAVAATWSDLSFRIWGGAWLWAPTPTAGQTIAYEYITTYIGTDTTGVTEKATFTVDTDLTYFDDELMILGIAKNVLDINGADYAEKSREFQLRLSSLLKQDGASRVISMSGQNPNKIPMAPRVPDRVVFT
jgi:hypothetical protein